MTLLRTTTRKLAAGAIAGVTVLGGGGAALAATSATHPAVTPAGPGVHTRHRHRAGRGLFRGADHITAEVQRNGSWVTLDWDRGTVTAFSSGSLTVLRPDKQSVTFTITSATRFRGRSTANLDGDRARVTSNSSGDALMVTLSPPKAARSGSSASPHSAA
ncbi:MAG: DUF5666 domain-containing protein [Actinomycetota bacterium]|nr:DUF5666 domain-containing protein [Actinomycetota bacterium]